MNDTKHIEQRFGGMSDNHVDVIVLEQRPDGLIASQHLHSVPDLLDHLALRCHASGCGMSCGRVPASSSVYLVQDLSHETVRLIGGYLDIPHRVFLQHLRGGETWKHRGHTTVENCAPLCPVPQKRALRKRCTSESTNNYHTFTWWRQKTCAMTTLKELGEFYLDCDDEREAFRNMALPFNIVNVIPGDSVVMARIFRSFHIIDQISEDIYECAAEEQITFYEVPTSGSERRICEIRPERFLAMTKQTDK